MNEKSDIYNFIESLESKYDVLSWEHHGFKTWPIIRIELFYQMFWATNIKSIEKIKTSSLRRIIETLSGIGQIIKTNLLRSNYQFIFSGSFSHRVFYNGMWQNRYFDPMMDYLEGKGKKTILIEYQAYENIKYKNNVYRGDRVIFLNDFAKPFLFIYKLKNLLRKNVVDQNWIGFEELISEVDLELSTKNKKQNNFKKQILDIIQRVDLYSKVYNQFITNETKYSFGLCYYNEQMFGMNLASHKNKIESFDMQHGPIGKDHIAYSNWAHIPVSGFEVFPKTFWLWNTSSSLFLDNWIDKTKFHKKIVGGNPFNYNWRKSIYTTNIKNWPSNIILYTTQPIGLFFEDYLIETIRQTKNIYSWWIRLHPRQGSEKEKLENMLLKEGLLDNVNINDASSLPLPAILQKTKLHLTKYSGSLLEAVEFGVPSIVLDKTGELIFEAEINQGLGFVNLSKDSTSLSIDIKKILSKKSLQYKVDDMPSYKVTLDNLVK